MNTTIKILASDIKKREYTDTRDCPIAQALKRVGVKDPFVRTCEFIADGVDSKGNILRDIHVLIPEELNTKVLEACSNFKIYDKKPETFKFEIEIPSELLP